MLKLLSKSSEVISSADMSKHTTIRAGGFADWFINAGSLEDFYRAADYCRDNNLPYKIIGRGSNLLVTDEGYAGVLIKLASKSQPAVTGDFGGIELDGSTLIAGAAESLIKVTAFARDCGLSGLEWASGIPGSVGGAAAMNAGAFGSDMSQVVLFAEAIYQARIVRLSGVECGFSYRGSRFLQERDYTVIRVAFGLNYDDIQIIRQRMEEHALWRATYQPKGVPNAGSTYKRLKSQSAGVLIDRCGLKGAHIGGAQVSKVHANFLINTGGATASDFIKLMELVEDTVYNMTGERLEREIEIIGRGS